jgi:methyl-accepting chemotaxis protein
MIRITKMIKLNLFRKILLMSILFIIIPVALVSSIGINSFSQTVENITISEMKRSAKNKLDLLQSLIEGAKREAYAHSQYIAAQKLLSEISRAGAINKASDVEENQKLVGEYLKGILSRSNGLYENLFFTDSKGIVVADATEGSALGVDVGTRDYFTEASTSGEITVSDVVISKSSGNPSMVVAVPIYTNDKFIGIFGIPIAFNNLTELLIKRTDGANFNYLLVNSQGDVIAHEKKELVFKSNLTKESESQLKTFQKMSTGIDSYEFYEFNGVKKVMAFTTYKEQNWYMCTAYTVNDYMRPVTEFVSTILICIFLCIIAALIIAFLFSRSISNPIKRLSKDAEAISAGDLTRSVELLKSEDEIGKLSKDFSGMHQNLRRLITEVSEMSDKCSVAADEMLTSSSMVNKASNQIATAMNELSQGANEQATASEKGNNMIIEVVSGLKIISGDMIAADELSEQAVKTVNKGEESVQYQAIKMNENKLVASEVADAINALDEKSKEIGEILGVINDISAQTNLLSLNAAIEASRAGEQGKGFTVVASEIRRLAGQSSASAARIDTIVKEVQAGVKDAVIKMGKAKSVVEDQEKALEVTIEAFQNIANAVSDIGVSVRKTADISTSLNTKANEAGDAIGEIASLSEETAASTEEVAASTEEQIAILGQIIESNENLSKISDDLKKSIGKFQV